MEKEYQWKDRILYVGEPTVSEMAEIGEIIKGIFSDTLMPNVEKIVSIAGGKGLVEILRVIVKAKDNKPVKVEEIDYKLAQEIVVDFFHTYKPLRWISGNMEILGVEVSAKSSGNIQGEK